MRCVQEERLKEGMAMMGMTDTAVNTAWLITYGVQVSMRTPSPLTSIHHLERHRPREKRGIQIEPSHCSANKA